MNSISFNFLSVTLKTNFGCFIWTSSKTQARFYKLFINEKSPSKAFADKINSPSLPWMDGLSKRKTPWKLNYDIAETQAELGAMAGEANSVSEVDLAITPVTTVLAVASTTLKNSRLGLAAQNVHFQEKGAFTGEWACHHLNELDVNYAIVGHSERRQFFGETNERVGKKVRACLDNAIIPIACIGESLHERETGQMWDVLRAQMAPILAAVQPMEIARLVVAYEPVWAIGTGKTASAAQAQEVHAQLRSWLAGSFGDEGAAQVRILYKNSVKPDNALELLSEQNVNGALVGGASLKADSFLAIARAARETR